MTTKDEISAWIERGIGDNENYMVVVCDTFSYDDYPVYYKTEDQVRQKLQHPGSMQSIMEVYDLNGDIDAQLNTRRSMAITL